MGYVYKNPLKIPYIYHICDLNINNNNIICEDPKLLYVLV